MEVDFTECTAHAKCSMNIGNRYNNYCSSHARYYYMFLRVLFLRFLKLSSSINIVFLTLTYGSSIIFILQPHEGKQSYWTAFFLMDEYLLMPYLTNYITTGC